MIRSFRMLVPLLALTAVPAMGCYADADPPVVASRGGRLRGRAPPAPPAVEVDVVPPPPGPEFYWVGGYHRWDGRRYVWIRGRYLRRPHAAARWEGAHWEGRGRSHVWIEGRWR